MGAILGALGGGVLAAHFGSRVSGAVNPGNVLKGFVAGAFAGAALDIVTPDVDRRKGVLGNVVGGVAAGAIGSALLTVGRTGFLPGGGWARAFAFVDDTLLPWARSKLPAAAPGKRRLDFSAHGLFEGVARLNSRDPAALRDAGPGGLGLYNMLATGPKPMQYLLGAPNLAGEITSRRTALGRMDADVVWSALRKDLLGSTGYGALTGAVGGVAAAGYYSMTDTPVPATPGPMGQPQGMYAQVGLASSGAINPLNLGQPLRLY